MKKTLGLALISVALLANCGMELPFGQNAASRVNPITRQPEHTIVIDTSRNLMKVFNKDGSVQEHLFKTRVITGRPGHATPRGEFTVQLKEKCPQWSPDGVTVVPGCSGDNPLGDYWIQFNGSYYGLHGTDKPWLFNQEDRWLSKGCIRVQKIAELFEVVQVGDKVLIY